jgi:hypothetical protein
MEDFMLEYTIIEPEGIVVLNPNASLTREDFAGLSTTVDAYLASHSNIHGVIIHAKSFPGWESFAGFVAHIRFVRDHHRKVERVALVTDSPIARVAEALANHFTSAEIRHFPFADYDAALAWLKTP